MIYFEPRLQHRVLTTLHVRLGTCEGLLLSELDHRVKNILAVVSAVVSQTVKSSTTPEAVAAEIEGRVQSIAKSAHSAVPSQAERDGAARLDNDGIGAL